MKSFLFAQIDLLQNKQALFEIVADLTEGVVGGQEFDSGRQWSSSVKRKPETTAGDDFSPSGRGGKAWFEEEEANRSRTTGDLTSEGDKNGSTERLLGDGESRETASEIIQRSQQKSETDGLHSDDEGKSQEANREPFPHLGDDDKNNKLQELITNLDLLIGDDRRNAREVTLGRGENGEKGSKKSERNRIVQSLTKRVGWPFFQEVFVVSALNGNGIDNLKVSWSLAIGKLITFLMGDGGERIII